MKRFFVTALAVLFLTLDRSARADNSVGFDITGGVGQSGFDTTGILDVGPEKDWETSLSFAHLHSTVGTESKTNQLTGGVEHQYDPAWDSHMNVTYWNDTLNDIHYAGPTLGFTYTVKDGGGSSLETPQERATSEDVGDDEMAPEKINPLEERKKAQANEARDLMSISLDTDLFLYGTEVTASSTTKTVLNTKTHHYVTETIPPENGTAHTTELHPNLTVEVPLFDDGLVPFITAGHDFYSTDPEALEALAGQPRLAASSGRLNSLVAGFLKNNGSVGFSAAVPWTILFSASLGAEQLSSDSTWATTQTAALSRTFFDRLKLKLEWNRAIQDGLTTDTITGGMTYKFGT